MFIIFRGKFMNFFINPDGSEFNVDVDKKICVKCKELILITNFPWHGGGRRYRRTECNECTKRLEKERKKLRTLYKNPPTNHVCPICNRTEEECKGEGNKKNPAFVLDHNHTTGQFRGWICHPCNRTLGGIERNIHLLNKFVEYLTG
jgi:hypothetical protein